MARVNNKGYIEIRTTSNKNAKTDSSTWRDWWFVKAKGQYSGEIGINGISFSKEMIGKKVRLKVEVIEDE